MAKRPQKTAQTKADFEQAFWKLYAQNPIEKITVQQVCDAAGYNRGTFYLHFHDLYELLAGIEDRVLEGMTLCVKECMQRLAGDDSKLARVMALKDVVKYYEANKRYIVVLLGAQGDASFIIRLKDELKPLWREYVIPQDTTRTGQEIDLLLEYTLSGGLFMISRWLQDPGQISALDMGHLVYDAAIKDVTQRALG